MSAGNGADREAFNVMRSELDREIATLQSEVGRLNLELSDRKARLEEKQNIRERLDGLFKTRSSISQAKPSCHSEPLFQPRPEGRYKDLCLKELRAAAPNGLGTLEIAERLRSAGQKDVKPKSISSALSQLKKEGMLEHRERQYFIDSGQ